MVASTLASTLASREGRAQTPPSADLAQISRDEASEPIGVRLAASPEAEERLGGVRLRRLLKIELEGTAQVEPGATGSLAGDLIRVWIHVPNSRRAIIEVRRNGRPLARRTLAIASFPADVAARVVAIEASEMVRVQARAVVRPPVAPQPATAPRAEGEGSTIAFEGGLGATFAPDSRPLAFLGPELALSHRWSFTGQRLYGRWLASLDGPGVRWLEIGAAFDFRFGLHADWRIKAGLEGGVVDFGLPEGTRILGEASDDALSIRAAGDIAIERRLSPELFIALAIEPGALVRAVDYTLPDGTSGDLAGFVFGTSLSLSHQLVPAR